MTKYFLAGCAFWGAGALALFFLRPGGELSRKTAADAGLPERLTALLLAAALILLCTLPMSLAPSWNGTRLGHRNQYEVLAESLLDGRIDLDYGDMDPKLLEMENPYDPDQRTALGVHCHWDHAFYNGHYYMYFGIVPVLLLFLPYRALTGVSLTTYHGTQVFAALFILGVFALFYRLSRRFFPRMPWSVYLSLSAAACAMSVWYLADAPSLYCTAISSAICMEIWSLFFFTCAVWGGAAAGRTTLYGVLGSLFGALAFGCRPTIALANLLAVPMFLCYIRGKRPGWKLAGQIFAVLMPYVLVGAGLMAYNYVRFDSPFEFGQSYQLTVADQSGYTNVLENLLSADFLGGLTENLIGRQALLETFPYISFQSVLLNFPICVIAGLCLLRRRSLALLRREGLAGFAGTLVLLPLLITAAQVLMSPFLLERYRSDIYWLMGIFVFLSFGLTLETLEEKRRRGAGFAVSCLALATIFWSFLLWTVPNDNNFTAEYPWYLAQFQSVLTFGFL